MIPLIAILVGGGIILLWIIMLKAVNDDMRRDEFERMMRERVEER